MKFRLLTIACVAALTATAASAQGWNASILGGPTWSPDLSLNGARAPLDNGFNVGGRLGYDIGDDYGFPGLTLALDTFYTQSHYSGTQSRASSLSFMGDVLYRVDFGSPFGIYGGGGVGAVRTGLDTPATSESSTVFGWQGIAGADYRFNPDTSMFVEYRYLNAHNANIAPFTGVGNTSDNVSVGLKFDL